MTHYSATPFASFTYELALSQFRGLGGRAVSPLASHKGDPISTPCRVTGFSHEGIVPDDAVGVRVFSGISRFPRPLIPVLLYTHLNHSRRPNLFPHLSQFHNRVLRLIPSQSRISLPPVASHLITSQRIASQRIALQRNASLYCGTSLERIVMLKIMGRKVKTTHHESTTPPTCSFFPAIEAESRRSDKGDTSTCFEYTIATERKALNWHAILCVTFKYQGKLVRPGAAIGNLTAIQMQRQQAPMNAGKSPVVGRGKHHGIGSARPPIAVAENGRHDDLSCHALRQRCPSRAATGDLTPITSSAKVDAKHREQMFSVRAQLELRSHYRLELREPHNTLCFLLHCHHLTGGVSADGRWRSRLCHNLKLNPRLVYGFPAVVGNLPLAPRDRATSTANRCFDEHVTQHAELTTNRCCTVECSSRQNVAKLSLHEEEYPGSRILVGLQESLKLQTPEAIIRVDLTLFVTRIFERIGKYGDFPRIVFTKPISVFRLTNGPHDGESLYRVPSGNRGAYHHSTSSGPWSQTSRLTATRNDLTSRDRSTLSTYHDGIEYRRPRAGAISQPTPPRVHPLSDLRAPGLSGWIHYRAGNHAELKRQIVPRTPATHASKRAPFANQRLVTYLSPHNPANMETFAACRVFGVSE
ncbi:hypothetical protein PR048_026066 [Dryococelus australis]|uniref:Uncharacterized protein n=1 Tax=Dryococelus australis TaxID=614101 RepID=A0ABQ9GKA6_9NEOP|nr:hypothetical protein PR048_026066 [Dryococelus australis]